MAALPYMPLYVADYLADAAHLSTLEHGAYLLLIMTYWQKGDNLPSSDDRLARIARVTLDEWMAMRDVLAEFFIVTPEGWFHKRIQQELNKVEDKSEKARAAGKASAQRRSSKIVEQTLNECSTDVQQTFNHTDTDTDTDKKEKVPFSCSEPKKAAELDEAVITIPLNNKIDYPVAQKQVDDWAELYPGIDVMQQLRAIKGWNLANPTKRKTKSGILRHINTWLSDKQNKAGINYENAAIDKDVRKQELERTKNERRQRNIEIFRRKQEREDVERNKGG